MQERQLILASGSPRRREILSQVGLTFQIQPAQADETLLPGLTPREQVLRLSLMKALATKAPADAVVLAADTVVVLDDAILGKPRDRAEAKNLLRSLSGEHRVASGRNRPVFPTLTG